MKYAFINAESIVVNCISGSLNEEQQTLFLNDYHKLFGAIAILEVPEAVSVWVGGCYDSDSGFLPPEEPAIIEEIVMEPEA